MGEVVQYGYDENAALLSVTGLITYVNSINYDYMGRITQLVRGAAVLTTDYSYYPWDTQGGRLQSLETSNSTSSLQDLVYNYDQVGNIQEIDDIVAGETLSYTYDTLNRLSGFYINAALTEAYSFDSQGRLENKGVHGYTYGDGDHVHAATAMGNNSYTYDENGNMVIRSLVSGTVTGTYTLTHNADNRLVGVSGPDSTTTYTYNGDLAQVIAIMEGSAAVTKTIYIGSYYEYQIVETLTSTVATTRTYYFAGSTRVAMRDNGTLIFLLSDHLGSTSLTTDASGGVLSVQKYMPYGEVRGVGGLETDYTYTGQRAIAHLGIMNYRARHYDPSLGRFLEADTIVSGMGIAMAFDRYMYVFGNPLRYVDPSGHFCVEVGDNQICSADADSDGWWRSDLQDSAILEDYEILLLTMAVMGESMNGAFPIDWIEKIAWIYLNRLSKGTHDTLYSAVKGVQSAYSIYERELFPRLETESVKAYVKRFFEQFANWRTWEPIYNLVIAQYEKWGNFGTGSFADPVNGATDFNVKQPALDLWDIAKDRHPNDPVTQNNYVLSLSFENGLSVYPAREKSNPEFRWGYSGPVFRQGLEMYLFWSNISCLY